MISHAHPELAGYRYVVFVNPSRQYIDFTDDVCDLLGYTREELLKKRIEDVSYENRVVELFSSYLRAGASAGDYVLQRKDRQPLPIHYRSFLFSDGCNAAIWEPITDWRQLYLTALLETDPVRLAPKIKAALDAIARTTAPDQPAREVMEHAAQSLQTLARAQRPQS